MPGRRSPRRRVTRSSPDAPAMRRVRSPKERGDRSTPRRASASGPVFFGTLLALARGGVPPFLRAPACHAGTRAGAKDAAKADDLLGRLLETVVAGQSFEVRVVGTKVVRQYFSLDLARNNPD